MGEGRRGDDSEEIEAPDTIEVITTAREPAYGEGARERVLARLREGRTRRRRPPIHYQRVGTARYRIIRVLQKRVVAYSRELERQVCEVGFNFATTPPNQRPEPVHYNEAMQQLTDPEPDADGEQPEPEVIRLPVEVLPNTKVTFFTLAWGDREEKQEALDRKIAALRAYLRVEKIAPISGWHAEQVHHEAMIRSGDWFSVGWKGGDEIRRMHSRVLSVGSVDLAALHHPTRVPVVAEVKNRREWFYEGNEVVWALLGAAAELEAVPVLITRRVPEPLFKFMKQIGGIAFPTTKLILPPDAEAMAEPGELTFGEATEELGFHSDIDYLPIDGALPRHRALWDRILPPQVEELHARFMRLQDDVIRIAMVEGLRSGRQRSKSGRTRPALVRELLEKARSLEPPAEKDG